MNSIPLVRANAILPLIKFLDQNGCPSERFLKQAKLPIAALENPETLIPLYSAFTFSELVARQEGIELFGVLAGQRVRVDDFGMFSKVACQSLTLYDFLNTISVLLTAMHNSGARVWLDQQGDKVWLNHQYINHANVQNQQAQYYACLLYLKIIQSVAAGGWHATDLHFQANKLKGLDDLDVFSQVRVRFNQPHNAIGFAKSLMCLPLKPLVNHHLSHQQREYETWQSSAPSTDLIGSLRQLVLSHLPDGSPSIALAAEAAGLSTRSLQRRLAEDGLSYSRLIDQVRFRLALDLLKDPSIQLMNVALELGYTEPATFTRSFQRWTGTSPSQFRQNQLFIESVIQ
jgi:AraC-like DNA-binding protein